jgi:hypothetical protein
MYVNKKEAVKEGKEMERERRIHVLRVRDEREVFVVVSSLE